ncbi:MAG TPA: translation initiation factor eIF-2B [Blastocatellia bacterium]|nr:translation initiation factor eIF-2B [Blastocatellia bacterium]
MSKEIDSALQGVYSQIDLIASDTRSGAAEILRRAEAVFSLLEHLNSGAESPDTREAIRIIIETCAALVRAQPGMAPLARLASAVAERARDYEQPLTLAQAALTARSFIERARLQAARAASVASGLIDEGATVLTHSRSSTVVAALLEAVREGRRFSVVATESRPGLEGRTLALELAREGLEVSLVADAAADSMMAGSSMVLFGADRVTPDALVNKIGTRMIALAARERGVPVYALTDSTKFIAAVAGLGEAGDERSGDEIWPGAPAGIRIVNRYFEPTPLDYLTAVVTEEGPLAPADARRRAESSRLDQSLIEALRL